jgi:hypothetical protein
MFSVHVVAKLDAALGTLWFCPQIRWISRRKTFRKLMGSGTTPRCPWRCSKIAQQVDIALNDNPG